MGVYDINYQALPANGPTPTFNPNNVANNNWFQSQSSYQAPSSLAPSVAPGGVQAPGMGATAGTGLGFNLGTTNLVLGGIGTIGNLWMAYQAQKLAKEQFAFQKDITNANFANQLQSYNTTLTDKINSRTAQEGGDTADAQAYVDNNKLEDTRKNK